MKHIRLPSRPAAASQGPINAIAFQKCGRFRCYELAIENSAPVFRITTK